MNIIHNNISNLSEMIAFLSTSITSGLFDSVEYDNEESPTAIQCIKDGHTLFQFTINGSGSWQIIPYVGDETVFISTTLSGSRTCFTIAKTNDGKTASFKMTHGSNIGSASFAADLVIYPTCFGDNIDLKLYTSGYHIKTNYADGSDRTIFTKIPVSGQYGSTGYFSTAFIRSVVQYFDAGEQIIGGVHYGCIYFVAVQGE